MKLKSYFLLSLEACICFLIVCWSLGLSREEGVWMETVAFFVLSLTETMHRKDVLSPFSIAIALIAGRILLEVPVRIYDWQGTMGSLPIAIACVIAIILGCAASYKGHKASFVICLILLYLLNIGIIHGVSPWIYSRRHWQHPRSLAESVLNDKPNPTKGQKELQEKLIQIFLTPGIITYQDGKCIVKKDTALFEENGIDSVYIKLLEEYHNNSIDIMRSAGTALSDEDLKQMLDNAQKEKISILHDLETSK